MAFKQCVPQHFPTVHHLYLLVFSIIIIVVFKVKLARKFFKIKMKAKDLNLPPCPTKLPIIGNLHQIAGTLPYRSFRALSQKYCGGADLMLLQLGHRSTPTVVVSSADAVREITKTHDLAFSNRAQGTPIKALLYGGNDMAFAPYGEGWKHMRKICVHELLSPKRVQSLGFIRKEVVEELVHKLREVSSNDACSSVNLSEMLVEAANSIICKCALGHKYSSSTQDCYKSVKGLARKVMVQLVEYTVGDNFPLLGWVDVLSGKTEEFKATFAALDALFDEVIAEHKKTMRMRSDGNEKDFVDVLIQLQERGMPDFELTNNDIKAVLLDMFVAGSDTTSVAIEWAMAELMKNQVTLRKAQEEVRRVAGHKSRVEESDINQMDYLKCVVKETLRLHPPVPLLPRETSSHVSLKGYDIPAKTTVHVNVWAIQRDPELWERPEEFIPERYDRAQDLFKGQNFRYIPFGVGRRGCPGMTFGLASVEYVLANLLHCFDWKLPELLTDDISAQAIDMSEAFGLVAFKKVPLHLKPISFSFEGKN